MCLNNSIRVMNELLNDGKEKYVVYKKLRRKGRRKGGEVAKLLSPFQSFEYLPGDNISNSNLTAPCKRNGDLIKGIHTYRTKRAARIFNQGILVRFIGLKEDLIGANHSQMVFKKVHLTQREYNRCLKPKKKKVVV